MEDFTERIRCCFEKLLGSYGEGATVKVTEISNRWPIPVEGVDPATQPRMFDPIFKGRTYVVVEIIYSEKYQAVHDTVMGVHPLPIICSAFFVALGLGNMVVGSVEDFKDRIAYPVPKLLDVYRRLPPVSDAKENWPQADESNKFGQGCMEANDLVSNLMNFRRQ